MGRAGTPWLAVLGAGLLALSLGGCPSPGEANRGVMPEITSMMEFTAYPGATVVETTGGGDNGPLGALPSASASRSLRTTHSPGPIVAHYRTLAEKNAQHGWTFSADTENGDPVPEGYEQSIRIIMSLETKMWIQMNIFETEATSATPSPKRKSWTIQQYFRVQ